MANATTGPKRKLPRRSVTWRRATIVPTTQLADSISASLIPIGLPHRLLGSQRTRDGSFMVPLPGELAVSWRSSVGLLSSAACAGEGVEVLLVGFGQGV
jgi:hypothetical protein